jgi:hypothetical protein
MALTVLRDATKVESETLVARGEFPLWTGESRVLTNKLELFRFRGPVLDMISVFQILLVFRHH